MNIVKTICPGCGHPASVYKPENGGGEYLRCTNGECPLGCECSIDKFKEMVEQDAKEVAK